MKNGFIKVAAASVSLALADVAENTVRIKRIMDGAEEKGVNLLVLPELCLCGASAMDLMSSSLLLQKAREGVASLASYTRGKNIVAVVGFPFAEGGKVYNAAAVMAGGKLLGIVPKSAISSRGAFAEGRVFAAAPQNIETVLFANEAVPFGAELVFAHASLPSFRFGVEIGSDSFLPVSPAVALTAQGASIIARPTATEASLGNAEKEVCMLKAASERLLCTYVSADASVSESTQDLVFSSHHVIAECGTVLAESCPFASDEMLVSEADVDLCLGERAKDDTYFAESAASLVYFDGEVKTTPLTRHIARDPFMPEDKDERDAAALHILEVQAHALARRIAHTHARSAILGISGGLDSTLALLVMVRAYDILGKNREEILAVTMPGFGTSDRTYRNACTMCGALGVRLREIGIAASVTQHFADIGQDASVHDVTYENAQARERTQILMDLANMEGGLVVGTGDLSELALGWATYNGDHMSMYAVNASLTKTQVRTLVDYEARHADRVLAEVLFDILDTPVSPELLPTDASGKIAQKTEDLVGPYELHDFFLYYTVRCGFSPEKIFRMARYAFADVYDAQTVLHWLRTFTRRFFTQQFKRSCLPDGPKTGAVSLSPRGAWAMPSDACASLWLNEIDSIRADEII